LALVRVSGKGSPLYLNALRSAKGVIPDTSGFFFGDSDGTELEDDLQFITDARAEIAKGNAVVYDSWW